jgi:hypothetical protein
VQNVFLASNKCQALQVHLRDQTVDGVAAVTPPPPRTGQAAFSALGEGRPSLAACTPVTSEADSSNLGRGQVIASRKAVISLNRNNCSSICFRRSTRPSTSLPVCFNVTLKSPKSKEKACAEHNCISTKPVPKSQSQLPVYTQGQAPSSCRAGTSWTLFSLFLVGVD